MKVARFLLMAALLPVAAHAQGVRDGNGNVIIRDDVAASRGMDPKKPFFTYSVDPSGNYVAPGGGGGGGGTVTQGPAATDTATNRWPVLAYQGGAWSVSLAGTLPAFAAVPTFSINQTTPGTTNGVANTVFDGTTWRPLLSTTTGALEPPTAAAGKTLVTSTSVAASTSTTIAAANANRISVGIQCGNVAGTAAAATAISETGATLTAATFGAAGASIFMPASTSGPVYFTPPIATRTAVTAYTATAQTCVVTEYLR